MVRVIIAFTCVSLLFPAPHAFAQSRSSGTKAPPAQLGDRSRPGVSVRPVARTQESDATPAVGARTQLNNQPLNQTIKPLDPLLEDLLAQWSTASEEIKRLEGEHTRIVYDGLAETERRSEGKFYYEKPDKGRIEIVPVEPTPALKKARAREVADAKAQKRKSGVRTKLTNDVPPQSTDEPYDLQPDQQELWCCDGQRVYNLDVAKKEALVAQLPADMQGRNIMDSPLPFLFGMPPEKAKQRFELSFSRPFEPKSGKAYLKILPRLKSDAGTWIQATVILDLEQFLPMAVQLVDPAGTKITVYTFTNFTVNKPTFLDHLTFKNPKTRFSPDMREFNVQIVETDGPPVARTADPKNGPLALHEPAKPRRTADPESTGLINVGGVKHNEAVLQLERQGLKRTKDEATNEIVLQAGPPAQKPEDIYTVRSQNPPPGTPLKPGMKVTLEIWNDPGTVKKQ